MIESGVAELVMAFGRTFGGRGVMKEIVVGFLAKFWSINDTHRREQVWNSLSGTRNLLCCCSRRQLGFS